MATAEDPLRVNFSICVGYAPAHYQQQDRLPTWINTFLRRSLSKGKIIQAGPVLLLILYHRKVGLVGKKTNKMRVGRMQPRDGVRVKLYVGGHNMTKTITYKTVSLLII